MTKPKIFSGSALKIIAILSMLTDHVGAVIIGAHASRYPELYYLCRYIGRLAFPIFCFLLIEGFSHTKDVKKYCTRLFLFALISEIPFDLAFNRSFFYPEYQNVFFTLFIGLITVYGLQRAECSPSEKAGGQILRRILILAAGMGCAWLLHTDYGETGVACIAILYLFRNRRICSMALVCLILFLMSPMEITAFLAIPLVGLYNGERGLKLKYVFYVFYPAHLLLLAFMNHYAASVSAF